MYRMQKREFPVRPFPILSRVSGAAVNAAERIRETPFALLCSLHPRTRTTSDREEQEKGESDDKRRLTDWQKVSPHLAHMLT